MNKPPVTLNLSILLLLVTGQAVLAGGTSPSSAAGTGETVPGIIECGVGYNSHELYDVKVTLEEVVRGEAARSLLASADAAPPVGEEHVLAKLAFSYQARGRPGDCVHELRPSQFKALSGSGVTYDSAEVELSKPVLEGPVRSGETRSGWLAFQVSASDPKPLLVFTVDENGAVSHGGNLWFRLQ